MRFIHFETVGSTQDEARALYMSGERGPLWVRADRQTKGRGRRSRNWVSETGNLFATYLNPNTAGPAQSALAGFAVAVAIAETIDHFGPQEKPMLKWPNDVLVGGAKISGLLVEREEGALLFGCGINITSHPLDTPYPATHLADVMPMGENMPTPNPAAVLSVLSERASSWLEIFEATGFGPVREAWLERAYHLGDLVTVNGQTGQFYDLGLDGALCLRLADGTETRVHAGDVSFG